ncbi:SMP-30/gluconolactonase/LRE family protein [Rhodoferax antarcticus]|uniref:Gluconolactonase n=1 Tax=Rhodoferax antarcticus ANT.BR TaxID=1111071 RepID=A0A1Q8YG03_9BURK|nr:SMP-30/gluconolactonase/LRE family protein [Rhodoferax antarcticus]APW45503.1 gluconolactonase [Rhodoferax antarcticus]OLP06956.1 gluconolactonase [Rhodoferax antarcticus ANT.BR]
MTTTASLADTLWQTVSPHRCQLGESPFWHPQEQTLYWLDIPGKQIFRANTYMGSVETWNMPSEPGCMAPAKDGGLVIALRDGVFRAADWGEPLVRLATLDYDPAHMRTNDGKCDAQGRFWVGTVDETRSLQNAALYCIDARGSGEAHVACKISPRSGMSTANGLAFSANSRTLYWADTPSHTVWAWDFDPLTADMSAQRVFARFAPKPEGWQWKSAAPDNGGHGVYGGRPDGATVDAQGNYWVAMYEGQRVCQFAPNGTLLASLTTPLLCPTMVCLGGEDLKTLYVTSAGLSPSAAEQAAYPLSGCVLSTRVKTAGLPVNVFQDWPPG